jgi:ribosomal protein S27E
MPKKSKSTTKNSWHYTLPMSIECPNCAAKTFLARDEDHLICTDCGNELAADSEGRLSRKESVDKVRVTGKIKRGTGTRDQDKIKIEARGIDADEAVTEYESALEQLKGTADTMRGIQPGDGDGE